MSNAKYIGRVGALAVALGVGIRGRQLRPQWRHAETADSRSCSSSDSSVAGYDRLDHGRGHRPDARRLLGRSLLRTSTSRRLIRARTSSTVPVTAPMEAWPLTGLARLMGIAARAPGSLGAWWRRVVAGRAVVETLGALRPHLAISRSRPGSPIWRRAMAEHGNDHLVIYGILARRDHREPWRSASSPSSTRQEPMPPTSTS